MCVRVSVSVSANLDQAWSSAPDCSSLSFLEVEKGAGKAGGYYNATEASWGGNIVKGPAGNYNLIHAQFANHCGIYSNPGGWTNNSFLARSVSTTGLPEGPYRFAYVSIRTRLATKYAHRY